ncbi:hypothetical protein [Jannaschia sp. LMIT008]|uniref:hypothetical protein n=1 Tax=Jannaschia maritima TaxID=3032585 RepID=UPI00281268A4|nr:hypothetical protein [Jannaschia sp. LMIT008]
MDIVLLLCGTAVLIVVTVDLLVTTVAATALRTPTYWMGRCTFGLLKLIPGMGAARVLTRASGVAVMSAVALYWILGTWLGWTLVFASGDPSIDLSDPGAEPTVADHASHAGHLLSTLGGARTTPATAGWGIVDTLVGVNGMVVLTMSVSFLLSVRQTVQQGRTFAVLSEVGAAPPGEARDRLAELVAGLHAAPLALWYGAPRADRQTPVAVLRHARAAQARGGSVWTATATILEDLPYLPDGERRDLVSRIREWAYHYVLDTSEMGLPDAVTPAANR